MKKILLLLTLSLLGFNTPANHHYEENLKSACQLNDGDACYLLGYMYYSKGTGVTQDYLKAKSYFIQACALNDGDSCNILGWMHEKGYGVRYNTATAKKFFAKACDLGDQEGCHHYKILSE